MPRSYEQRFHEAFPDFPDSVPTDRLLEVLSEIPELYRTFIENGLADLSTPQGDTSDG